jgi:uncharacterized protein (DUF1330 family)
MGTLMKPDHKTVFALIVGAVTGGAIVQALHAESKPPAYVVGEVDVANHDAFVKEYVPLAMKALSKGGYDYKAIAVGGRTAVIEGEPPRRIVINAFANLDAAIAAYNSPAYKEAAKIGNKYGTFRIYAVEGLQR